MTEFLTKDMLRCGVAVGGKQSGVYLDLAFGDMTRPVNPYLRSTQPQHAPTRSNSDLALTRTVEDVELATLSWVHWFNTERLHGYLGDIPPVEAEEVYYAQLAVTR